MKSPTSRQSRIDPAFLRDPDFTTFTANERRLLNLVRYKGPLSRADMARESDLTMQSVVRLMEGLLARGVVAAGERKVRGLGQPPVMIELVPEAAFAFGVSIMTDTVNVVLMDLAGRIRTSAEASLDTRERLAVVAHVKTAIADLLSQAGVSRDRVFGIGVATTGYFIAEASLNPPEGRDDWALVDLETMLADALDLPVWLENDGNAAAAGESLFGAGQRLQSFAYLYVARGLGGGVVLDGRLLRGFHGNAGEFTGILPPAERINRPTLALLLEILQDRGVMGATIAELVAEFDPAWPGVETFLERSRSALTTIVSGIAATLDPEAIVIGGQAPRALALLLAERANYFAVPTRGRERPFPPVIAAEAQGAAAALGAAAIPFKEHFFG